MEPFLAKSCRDRKEFGRRGGADRARGGAAVHFRRRQKPAFRDGNTACEAKLFGRTDDGGVVRAASLVMDRLVQFGRRSDGLSQGKFFLERQCLRQRDFAPPLSFHPFFMGTVE